MRTKLIAVSTGSEGLMLSEAGQELIPDKQAVRDFSFCTSNDCRISINNGAFMYLRAGQTQNINTGPVYSCKIQEAGIEFNWTGTVFRRSEI